MNKDNQYQSTINKKNIFIIFLFIVIGLIYFKLTQVIYHGIFTSSKLPYYNYLIDSLLNKRLNLCSSNHYDLSIFNNKWYMYWGPAPIIFIFPFYLISKTLANDRFYTLVAGFLNTVIFYLVVCELIKYFKLKLSEVNKIIIALAFAFVSPNFYLSLNGAIWHTTQVLSIFYLLLFLLFFTKFLNNLLKLKYLVIATIFFNLAWLSRYTLIFYGLYFLFLLLILYKRKFSQLILKKTVLIINLITLTFLLVFFAYNYMRFGNPLETGYKYHQGSPKIASKIKANGETSLSYIPHNFKIYFLNHLSLSLKKPYVRFDFEGNSIFSTYPIIILLYFIFQKKYLKIKKNMAFIVCALIIIIINLFFLLVNAVTGWIQFGNRFFFDIVPIVYLLLLFVLERSPIVYKLLLLSYGILVNFLGIFSFFLII